MRVLAAAVIAAVTTAAVVEITPADRRSGYDFAGPETRAMQDDDTANPGMLEVLQGETLWAAKAGARSPARSRRADNRCRTEHQRAAAFTGESEDLVALAAFVAYQSRGVPIAVQDTAELQPFLRFGERAVPPPARSAEPVVQPMS